jgi:soluble lytic murein transglycosylase-like protein
MRRKPVHQPWPTPTERFSASAALVLLLALMLFSPKTKLAAEEDAKARARRGAWAYESAESDSIVAVRENGRTIYVNGARRPKPAMEKSTPPASHSVLVYWSNKDRAWKPVPPPSPSAMRAARSAAAEVSTFIEAQAPLARRGQPAVAPEFTPSAGATMARDARAKPRLAAADPNYRRIARGLAVSAAEVDAVIEAAAARHGVDPNLVRAIIKVESNFNPGAVSKAGAMGLMQLMPKTARQLNVSDPFDPQQNVEAGVRHLRQLMDNFGGNLPLTLAAYNAGETAVARSNGIPRNSETQNYVKQITSMYWTGGPMAGSRGFFRRDADSIRVFRGPDGVLTISNTD